MWWDERSPGGRLRSLIFLGHPGPSILVTVVFVAIAGLAERGVPDAVRILQLAGTMLPIQLCIGVINDVVDLPADIVAQPYKPLVRRVLPRSAAAWIGAILGAIGLGAAATINLATLGLGVAALGAGLSYDLGLRRTALSWVPWWGGMAVLPLMAYASAGSIPSRLLVLIPLAALVATGLHLANAMPDIESDRVAGVASFPVLIGSGTARWAGPAALGAAGVLALALAGSLHQAGVLFLAGMAVFGCGILAAVVTRPQRPFPILAVATAVFAVTWLASLPAR
ncbi:MAG: UbiA family prenyltransferase [Candidatus Dormiibacterota bacterium]